MSYFEINKFGKTVKLEGTEAYIGLGSNLENPMLQIMCATKMITLIPKTYILASSSLYKSKPIGPENQPDYVNAVVKIVTQQSAEELLIILEFIEAEMGRLYKEDEERWGPRLIDLDILIYGEELIKEKHLVVPHKELHRRSFVLKPLEEIDPFLTVPGETPVPLTELINKVDCNDLEMVCKVTHTTVEEAYEAKMAEQAKKAAQGEEEEKQVTETDSLEDLTQPIKKDPTDSPPAQKQAAKSNRK